jgi:hypothetical protein
MAVQQGRHSFLGEIVLREDILMRWLVGLILVGLVNLVYGLVIQLSANHYPQKKRANLS